MNQSSSTDTCQQIKDFWRSIGFFTKLTLVVNLISYLVTNVALAYGKHGGKADFDDISLCPAAVIDSGQYYRLFTSEITHGSPGHIMFNMVTFMLWGTDLEKYYGTAFYASVNVVIGIISNFLTIGIQFAQAYYFPVTVAGCEVGGPRMLLRCGIGYSNILFGLMMLEAFMGDDTHRDLFCIKVRKAYIPWIWMVLIQVCIPQASFIGHLTGIIAALLIKNCGLSFALPKYEWIDSFESSNQGLVSSIDHHFKYYNASQNQGDFGISWLALVYNT